MDDMARIWPIIVQFGGGTVLCAIGLWCGITSKYLDLSLSEDRRLIGYVIGGFIFLLLLSSAFTFWLPNLPAEAAQ
ncbi:MAG: hypothetical protein COA73_05270 [Candidatus Hydrogenedentota bacterium]|nr:MAG: hypothetical protein COA73_05270 [Candidatus Hydrogenedentota bacterium]